VHSSFEQQSERNQYLPKILPGGPGSQSSCDLFPTHLITTGKGDVGSNSQSSSGSANLQGNSIESNLRYTALSYVLGDQEDTATILVFGKELAVTRNLFKFLQCRRDTLLTNKSTAALFWTDAICIDQSNIDERSRQVEFMADVYKEAQNVLIWLGEESADTSIAFETARKWKRGYLVSEQESQACFRFERYCC